MKGGHLNQVVAMTPQRTHGADFIIRPEGTAQQSHEVEVLNPLTVGNIGLSAGLVFYAMGVDQPYVELAFFQDLKQRDPVHSGGFHGHGSDLALLKLVRQLFQIDGKRRKTPNRLRVVIGGNRDENLRCPNIDPCGVRLDDGEACNSVALLGYDDFFSAPSRWPGPCKKVVSQTRSAAPTFGAAASSLY